jgi:hypothetical protein
MSEATYYNWKTRYASLTVSELKRLKALEEENRRLKQIVAEQTLDNRALKGLLSRIKGFDIKEQLVSYLTFELTRLGTL